jgi:hypothetical protein
MCRTFCAVLTASLALGLVGQSSASGGTQPGSVSIQVQKPSVAGSVHISFRPTDRLPPGGYYYAVIVLEPYEHYTQKTPPPCAVSSNMERTDYGYPRQGRPVKLALTPAKSFARHWCRGGVYSGAIYAVPYAPPCNSTYPCRSEPYKELCVGVRPGCVLGIVARPKLYRYPDGLPTPLAKGTRIVGRFQVKFSQRHRIAVALTRGSAAGDS